MSWRWHQLNNIIVRTAESAHSAQTRAESKRITIYMVDVDGLVAQTHNTIARVHCSPQKLFFSFFSLSSLVSARCETLRVFNFYSVDSHRHCFPAFFAVPPPLLTLLLPFSGFLRFIFVFFLFLIFCRFIVVRWFVCRIISNRYFSVECFSLPLPVLVLAFFFSLPPNALLRRVGHITPP